MKLRSSLQEKNEDLYSSFRVIEARAKELLEYSQAGGHFRFTTHGLSHISRVEACYDFLLSDTDVEAMNSSELFCLLCATLLHDILMIPRHLGDEDRAREDHAISVEKFLNSNKEHLPVTHHQASVIGEVVKGHSVWDLEDIDDGVVLGTDYVHIRKLAACLSLADICHADDSRAPMIVFEYLNFDDESAEHWKRHMQISGLTRKDDNLIMSALVFSDDGKKAVESYKEMIEKQLSIVSPYFRSELQPISKVKLLCKRRSSPIEQTLNFETDMGSILNILIEGIYENADVFLREIIQNALDASYLRAAKSIRRTEKYQPKVLITYFQESGKTIAVRVDDNGVGMDISDVKDTLLLIGGSNSNKKSIQELLKRTTQKNLIATFGIGLLSCFKVAKNVRVQSSKERATPIDVQMNGVSEPIVTKKSSDSSKGTSIFIMLKPEYQGEIDVVGSINSYCRMVTQAEIEVMELEWDTDSAETSRDDLQKLTLHNAVSIEATTPKSSEVQIEIGGEDYLGWLWLPDGVEASALVDKVGTIEILNDGILVCNDSAANWLPETLQCCDGLLNFSAGAIDLPVSRDRVVSNPKFELRKKEISAKSLNLVQKLANCSKIDPRKRKSVVDKLIYMWSIDSDAKNKILDRISDLHVKFYGEKITTTSLSDLLNRKPAKIYLAYDQGHYVSELVTFDGSKLYKKNSDEIKLQAVLLSDDGETVLDCSTHRLDETDESEATILKAFFMRAGIDVIDIADKNPKKGSIRSLPVPREIRQIFGGKVKFVEVSLFPNKRAWVLGEDTWLNVANPTIKRFHAALQNTGVDQQKIQLAQVLVQLLSYELNEAIDGLVKVICSPLDEEKETLAYD